jgi:hypothetical protein
MMKIRARLLLATGLLVLVIALFTFQGRDQEAVQVFAATINRDCAPWDGAAFTMSVSYDTGTVLSISIWQAPEINFPFTISLSGDGEKNGYAYILQELGPFIQLHGNIFFQRVNTKEPVQGNFDLTDENGNQFSGKFIAEWRNEVIYCG